MPGPAKVNVPAPVVVRFTPPVTLLFNVRLPAARFSVCAVPSTTGTFNVCALAELLIMPLTPLVSVLPVDEPMMKLPAVLLKVMPATL